jgi:pimeloyl-ACP methyl ester carboxylesterase
MRETPMQLNAITHAPQQAETGPPLLIAHGLFGSARNWNAVARLLAARRRVVALDMRNHGESPHAPENAYADMADDLAEAMVCHAEGEADLLGHSMGGKAAMLLALTREAPLRRLVVADIAPAAYGHSHLPYVQAMQAIDLGALDRRSEVEARLAPDVPDRGLRAFLLHSLERSQGGLRWRLNLDALARAMPELIGWPDPPGRWEGPALFMRGGDSDYAGPRLHDRIRALFPNALIETLPGRGHWLHAEAPAEFAEAVARFLDA